MLNWIRALDRVLRGEATSIATLRRADLDVPVWGMLVLIDVLGLIYGLCMGVYGLAGGGDAWKQTVSCMFKVPALFLLTLLVTFPSLYVFNAMVGSRLTYRAMTRLLVAALAVMLAVLASIGPIVAFLAFTTTSVPFMFLLNVAVYATAGLLGMAFLLQSLHRLAVVQQTGMSGAAAILPVETASQLIVDTRDWTVGQEQAVTPPPLPAGTALGALQGTGDHLFYGHVRSVFRIWVLVFGLVGAQMAWVLRPFIPHPHQAFALFRPIGSNFFEAVWNNLQNLMR